MQLKTWYTKDKSKRQEAELLLTLRVETSLIPAKTTCQRHDGVRRDGVDHFVNDFCQGSGLGLADGPGDVFIVQETYNEKNPVVLAPRQSRTFVRKRQRVTPNLSKAKMLRGGCKNRRQRRRPGSNGLVADFMRGLGFLSGPPMNKVTRRRRESGLQPNKSDDSGRQRRGEDADRFPCQKLTAFSLHEAEMAARRMMDSDPFDKDACQLNASSDGRQTAWEPVSRLRGHSESHFTAAQIVRQMSKRVSISL